MSIKVQFGSPALCNELDRAYGCSDSDNQEKVSLRDSTDVSKFLEEVQKFEQQSGKIKLQFG